MFEKVKRILARWAGRDDRQIDEPDDDRDAGVPVPFRRRPPDGGSSIAVAEPDEDD